MTSDELEKFIFDFSNVIAYKKRNQILNKPNFIGVGSGRCGTTSLHAYLAEHPDVYMSPVKEVNYFGISNLEVNPYGISFREYLYYFLGAKKNQCIGEFSPVYLHLPDAAPVMHKHLPNLKIIITVRSPIDRAISQYKHHFKHHAISDINEYFKQAIDTYHSENPNRYKHQWFHPVKNLIQSLYFDSVKRYLDLFGEERVYILSYDILRKDSASVVRKLCSFLDINYDGREMPKANYSSAENIQSLVLSDSLFDKLAEIFRPDIEKLDSFLPELNAQAWLSDITR